MNAMRTIMLTTLCLCALALFTTSCVVDGRVTNLTLSESVATGSAVIDGNVQVRVMTVPAGGSCQGQVCPIEVSSSDETVAQIQGAETITLPGDRPRQVIFAQPDGHATFSIQTQSGSGTQQVAIAAQFWVCQRRQDAAGRIDCQPKGASIRHALEIRQDLGFTCGDPFESAEPAKPPLPPDNLPLPPDFADLILNKQYRIGFHFVEADAGLQVQPAGAFCKFHDATLGVILGAVWLINPDQTIDSYVVSAQLAGQESTNGFLIDSKGQVTTVTFAVTPLLPTVEPEAALPIDATIRADAVCFRFKDQRYCSRGSDASELAVRERFADFFQADVMRRIEEAVALLTEREFLREPEKVLPAEAISEIEAPERIRRCQPMEANTCQADVVVAPLAREPIAAAPILVSTSLLETEVELGVVVVAETLPLSPTVDTLLELPPGAYVIFAQQGDDGLIKLPVSVRGVEISNGTTITGTIPALIMPYIDPNDPGTVEIFDVGLWKMVCIFWEKCGFVARH